MFCLSQSVGYAIRGLSCLVTIEGDRRFVRDVAEASEVPAAYLAKLFKKLSDTGILESKRGWAGGTHLTRNPEEISLLEISEAIDGKEWLSRCLLGMDECSEQRSCPTHDFWKATRQDIKNVLQKTTLADVIEFERKRGLTPGDSPKQA